MEVKIFILFSAVCLSLLVVGSIASSEESGEKKYPQIKYFPGQLGKLNKNLHPKNLDIPSYKVKFSDFDESNEKKFKTYVRKFKRDIIDDKNNKEPKEIKIPEQSVQKLPQFKAELPKEEPKIREARGCKKMAKKLLIKPKFGKGKKC